MLERAYSLLTVKNVNDEQRVITGVATTPTPDRMNDVVEPLGVKFNNPMPLLHQHDSTKPVGTVSFNKPTKDGITFQASLPKIAEAGPLKDRVDTAWGEVKAGLIRAVSIGFRTMEDGYEIMKDGGIRYLATEVLELSLVSVPAQAEATIQTIKSIDTEIITKLGKSADPAWHVGAARDLPISDTAEWDGPAATERMLDAAGFNGNSPDGMKARKGFLVYDGANPNLKASYKLPFADIVGGSLKAVAGGLRAAASRLPQTDIPDDVSKSARSVLDVYFAKLSPDGDKSLRATQGRIPQHPPVDRGPNGRSPARKGGIAMPKTIAEQISAFEASRQAKTARMDELMNEVAEKGVTFDDAQTEEYEGLDGDVKALDSHLVRLRDAEKRSASTAKAVGDVRTVEDGARARAGVVVKAAKLAPGIGFARVAKCIALGKISGMSPVQIAEERYKDDPSIASVVKAAVTGGSSASGNWAQNLTGTDTNVFADFAEFLRPLTILGRFGVGNIPALRRVPFRVPLVGQTGGGSGYWVGEGNAKPLTAFDFTRTTLAPLKVANIAVVTMETIRDSSPSAETIVRDQLAAALRSRLDTDFINPSKAASAGVSPASITHGVSAVHSSGNDAASIREDMRSLFGTFIAANNAPTNGVWIMSATTALSLSLLMNALGQPEFPAINMNGGMLQGLPVITSEFVPSVSAGTYVALINASDIYEADDGDVMVDMSMEASLEMSDSPTNNVGSPTAAQLVSLWQTNSVGFRAERTINWAARRTSAVALLDEVNWGLPSSS